MIKLCNNYLEHRQKQLEEQGRGISFGATLGEMERLRTAVAGGYGKLKIIKI